MKSNEFILVVDPVSGDIERLRDAIDSKFGCSERPAFPNVIAVNVDDGIDLEALKECLIESAPGEHFILIGPTDGLVAAEGI